MTGASLIENINIIALQNHKAIALTPYQSQTDFGQLSFHNLELDGQISLIFRAPTLSAKVLVDQVHVNSADTRTYPEQPQKYGVNVLQGAFTLYNFNADANSLIETSISHLSIGRQGHPVIGSGLFISGFNDQGGKVKADKIQLDAIYSTGMLPQGVSDIITGAVFIVYGAEVDNLIQDGETITYGVNDMVLDAWGTVHNWTVNQEVISYGPSGVGFVNFGQVDSFRANRSISTFGLGARAYNQYDGSLTEGYFKDINTYNDGAVGIQISKKVGKITIDGDLKTKGGVGQSLVKGVNVDLPAYAFSLKNGGALESLTVNGTIETSGQNVTTVTMEDDAQLGTVSVTGEITANGQGSKAFGNEQVEALFSQKYSEMKYK